MIVPGNDKMYLVTKKEILRMRMCVQPISLLSLCVCFV